MKKPLLLAAAALLAAPALAQTAAPNAPAPPAAPPSTNREAILSDAPATPRSGETDVGATSAPSLPAGARAYPPCSRTVTDSCIQSERRSPR